jgi:large subunit ribosomal protein L9
MAQKIQLLLRESVPSVGKTGDIVRVAPGFARNYLMPRKLATEATEENKKVMAKRRAKLDAEESARNVEIEKRVVLLSSLSLVTRERADDKGSLFGSVNASNIVKLLAAVGHPVDEKDVRLEHALKALGTHKVKIHVHGERHAEVTVLIEATKE